MELALQYDWLWLLAFIGVAFLAGYVDAIAGGGGMLQVPILLIGGLSPVSALATNKIISMAGTGFTVLKYSLNRLIIWRFVLIAAIPCALASAIGSQMAIATPDWLLEIVIIACIVLALVVSLCMNPKADTEPGKSNYPKFVSLLTSIGLYDGFAGPGTGSFMVIANKHSLGYNLLTSTAIAKPVNLLTNVAAAIIFVMADTVIWAVAIPMLLANSLGGWVGGHVAIAKGSNFIRNLLVTVLIVMLFVNIGQIIF